MEFGEKLQGLRKRRGLTQEELAAALYVSRTAVSKWESGRGYPNLDSLKAIAVYFAVSVDELLSGEQLLTVAEADNRQRLSHVRDLVFGALDAAAALLLFLPFFGETVEGGVHGVSLLALTEIAPYMRVVYMVLVVTLTVYGILTLSLQRCESGFWLRCKSPLSLLLSALCLFTFILSPQPYAAALLFVFLTVKALMLLKRG